MERNNQIGSSKPFRDLYYLLEAMFDDMENIARGDYHSPAQTNSQSRIRPIINLTTGQAQVYPLNRETAGNMQLYDWEEGE